MESHKTTGREIFIDYLRAFVTLLVLAHHSSLAYTTFARVNTTNYLLSTAPIVDSRRWIFLDYAENFNDVFFMSLMFFISGLFVWPVLKKRGAKGFLRDRLVRLGLPFLVGVVFLMPVAYYPSWLASGGDPGYLKYWLSLVRGGWPPGPLWFIWVLLLFDLLAAGAFLLLGKKSGKPTVRSMTKTFLTLLFISANAYIPMLALFGFSTWVPFFIPPFWFQIARIFLYLTWFIAGIVIGSRGIREGILAENGSLARHWPWWLAACLVAYNLLVFVLFILRDLHVSQLIRDLIEVHLWVLSCCASCFGLLALFRRFVTKRRIWMDSIARSAYVMYIIHYIYVIWIQYFYWASQHLRE